MNKKKERKTNAQTKRKEKTNKKNNSVKKQKQMTTKKNNKGKKKSRARLNNEVVQIDQWIFRCSLFLS